MMVEIFENEWNLLNRSLARSLFQQTFCRYSLLAGGTSRVPVEIPNLSLAAGEAMMGKDGYAAASKGKETGHRCPR
jgi:hypothetical protein